MPDPNASPANPGQPDANAPPSDPSSPPADPMQQYAHMLPPGYKPAPAFELQSRESRERARRGWAAGIGAAVLAVILKFKGILVFLLNFKWIALGLKFLLSFGSLLLSIVAWAQIWGIWFATGFVLLILIHELGHYFAIRAYGLQAGLPVFLPFLGAFTTHKDPAPNALASALIALAGPLLGGAGAAICYVAGLQTGNSFWFALASTMFFINLFNLIPIGFLDGGRIASAIGSLSAPMSRNERIGIIVLSIALAIGLALMWHVAGSAVRIAGR